MNNNQYAMYITAAYATTLTPEIYCGNPNCTEAMLNWGKQTMAWMNEDRKMIGVLAFHWETYKQSDVPGFEIGAIDLPAVTAYWKVIGKQIINN